MSDPMWRWRDASGFERTGTETELKNALQQGGLPPTTLVWRDGMGGWAAASSVGELWVANLAPGLMRTVPLAGPTLEAVQAAAQSARAAPMPVGKGKTILFGEPLVLPPTPPAPAAPSMGPLAPPPTTPPPAASLSSAPPPIATPYPSRQPPAAEGEGGRRVPSVPPMGPMLGHPVEPAHLASAGADASRKRRVRMIVGGVLGALGVLTAVGLVVRAFGGGDAAPVASASASASAPPPPPAPVSDAVGLAACSLSKPAARLAPRVSELLPIEVGGAEGASAGETFFVGFSPDGRSGQGVEVALSTLKARRAVVPRAAGKLRRVAPGGSGWVVDSDLPRARVKKFHTVAAPEPFVVGIEGDMLAAAVKPTDAPTRLWPSPVGFADSVRVALVPGDGSVVAAHASEALWVGRLNLDRTPRGAMSKLVEQGRVGPVALGVSEGQVAALFPFRSNDAEPWGLKVARGGKGDAPTQVSALTVGGEAQSPALAAAGGGRWVVAWVEGSGQERVVKLATFSPSFAMVGQPVTISAPGAGVVALGAAGGKALVAFSLKAGKGIELWGAGVACP